MALILKNFQADFKISGMFVMYKPPIIKDVQEYPMEFHTPTLFCAEQLFTI
jgi:hypothetical protein